MAKLQRIKRTNGSLVHSVNIPLERIENLSWEKGQELSFKIQEVSVGKILIIYKSEDNLNG